MTTLLLVRHGETEWNEGQRMQGRTDIDLSVRGRTGVTALAPRIAAWQPRTLIVSPLTRTRTTASLLSELEPIVDEAWIEHGLGEWEGFTPDAIGPDYARWRAGELVPPGGEPRTAIRERVTAAVHAAAGHPGPVLVVTHGGTIRCVLDCFLGLAPAQIRPVDAPSLTVLDVAADGAARLRQLNLGA